MDQLRALGVHAQTILYNPTLDYKRIALTVSWAVWGFDTYILCRQLPTYSYPSPPVELKEHIDSETYNKSQSYGKDKAWFSFGSQFYQQVIAAGFMTTGIYTKCWDLSADLMRKCGVNGDRWIVQSIGFVTLTTVLSSILTIPSSIYSTFVVEEKHGFNKTTPKLFAIDTVKQAGVGFALGWPFLGAFLWIADWAGEGFVMYLMGFLLAFTLSFQIIYPTFIQPLFNKLDPLPVGELRTKVEALAGQLGFPLKHLYVIDGSKRSSHSNAYFYGLPWDKHIVIYDTLIEQSSVEEVVAVLAHELGHWKYNHPTKLLAIAQFSLFTTLSLWAAFMRNPVLFTSFGFPASMTQSSAGLIIGYTLFSLISSPLDSVMSFGMNSLTRRFEYQADKFAVGLGYKIELSAALIKLQKKNLTTPHYDWLYSAWNHSHPTLSERLRAIDDFAGSAPLQVKQGSKQEAVPGAGKKDL